MSARHQLRIGNRRLGRDRAPIDVTSGPPVGETLQLARERKGVDLYRAERDTKIRLRYLAALEDGDWNELPAPVYTKGFLRNYAIYLGLEPDEILDRWRDEMEALRTATRVAVAPPPMPIVEPGGRRFTITPGMVVAGSVALLVFLFVGYIGLQLLRFVADTPPVTLTYPANVVSQIDATEITLQGTAAPGAVITITGPDGAIYNAVTDEAGSWTRQVNLARGENRFNVVATDPVTQHESKLVLTINVPLPSPSPGSTATPLAPLPLTLSLTSPPDGAVIDVGSVTFSGTTSGTRITIASTYLGAPGEASPTPFPLATETPEPSAGDSPSPPPVGPARDITVSTGSFSQMLEFPIGHWRVAVTAYASGLEPVSRTIELTVGRAKPSTLSLLIEIIGGRSWLRVLADGVRVPGLASHTATRGESFTATAQNEFCVRAGNAGSLRLTLNGAQLDALGGNGEVGSWIINGVDPPTPAPEPC